VRLRCFAVRANHATARLRFNCPTRCCVCAAEPASQRFGTNRSRTCELHVLQDTRSPAQVAHARGDGVELDIFIFRDVLETFNRNAALTAMLSTTSTAMRTYRPAAKKYFHRPARMIRPTFTCLQNNRNITNYHIQWARNRRLFGSNCPDQMVPEKRDAILARAETTLTAGWSVECIRNGMWRRGRSVAYAMIGSDQRSAVLRRNLRGKANRRALGL